MKFPLCVASYDAVQNFTTVHISAAMSPRRFGGIAPRGTLCPNAHYIRGQRPPCDHGHSGAVQFDMWCHNGPSRGSLGQPRREVLQTVVPKLLGDGAWSTRGLSSAVRICSTISIPKSFRSALRRGWVVIRLTGDSLDRKRRFRVNEYNGSHYDVSTLVRRNACD
jgi:hypothetical protein